MLLTTGVPAGFVKGHYLIQVSITSGTATLDISTDGLAYQQITDASWTGTDEKTVKLCNCNLQATLTGDAAIAVNLIEHS